MVCILQDSRDITNRTRSRQIQNQNISVKSINLEEAEKSEIKHEAEKFKAIEGLSVNQCYIP
jgi:hypothetical protein